MLKTIVRTAACLAVSAAAFLAVAKLDASAARPRSPSVPETAEPKPAPKPPAPRPTDPAPKLTLASLNAPAPAAATAAAPTRALVTVPDWKGKRVSVARRDARKLGFHLLAFDETGAFIDADEASSYRVRRQITKAGTALEPGASVEVRAREIVDAAAGY
jgi:hypothetical protein